MLAVLLQGCVSVTPSDSKDPEPETDAMKYPDDPDVKLDLPYSGTAPDKFHTLDLYLPKNADSKTPLLVFVHGGAWIGNDKSLYRFFGDAYRAKGITVAIVNYRISSQTNDIRVPDHARDVAEAISFLAVNKAKYAYDSARIYLVGHSAGAHTIAYLASDASLYRTAKVPPASLPRGYVGLEGIYDVPKLVERHASYASWFIEQAFGDRKNWPAGSPTLRSIESKAPWIVVHSKGDVLVEMGQSTDFVRHLKQTGIQAELVTVDALSHDDVVKDATLDSSRICKSILSLIRNHV